MLESSSQSSDRCHSPHSIFVAVVLKPRTRASISLPFFLASLHLALPSTHLTPDLFFFNFFFPFSQWAGTLDRYPGSNTLNRFSFLTDLPRSRAISVFLSSLARSPSPSLWLQTVTLTEWNRIDAPLLCRTKPRVKSFHHAQPHQLPIGPLSLMDRLILSIVVDVNNSECPK